MSHHDCVGGLIFRICKKNQKDASSWFLLLMYITTHGSKKRTSCWFFLHMYITMHCSENVKQVFELTKVTDCRQQYHRITGLSRLSMLTVIKKQSLIHIITKVQVASKADST